MRARIVSSSLLRQGVLNLLAKADALIVRFRRRTPVEGVAHPDLVFDVGRVADDRREPPVIDGVHDVAALADAARREFARLGTGDDRVEILSIALSSIFHRLPSARRAQTLRARISSTPLLYFFCRLLPSMAPGSRTSLA